MMIVVVGASCWCRTKWKNHSLNIVLSWSWIMIIIEFDLFSNNMCCPLKSEVLANLFWDFFSSSLLTCQRPSEQLCVCVCMLGDRRKRDCFETMQMRLVFLRVSFIRKDIYIHSINFNYVITLRERDDEDDDEVLFLKHRFRTSRHMRQWPMGKDEQQQ